MDEIRWDDLPAAGRAPAVASKWQLQLAPLMEHPKRWAIIATKDTQSNASSTAALLRRGVLLRPPGRWEFASRTVDGEHRIYARYLGPDKDGVS